MMDVITYPCWDRFVLMGAPGHPVRVSCAGVGTMEKYGIMNAFIDISEQHLHWKPRIVIKPTLSSLLAPEVVVKTTFGAASNDKVGMMIIHGLSVTTIKHIYQADIIGQ